MLWTNDIPVLEEHERQMYDPYIAYEREFRLYREDLDAALHLIGEVGTDESVARLYFDLGFEPEHAAHDIRFG